MADRRRRDTGADAETPLPAELGLEELYGTPEELETEEEDLVVVPPVRLPAEAELAAAARNAPLLDLAVRLARWVAPEKPVDEWGELGAEQEATAARELGLHLTDSGELEQPWSLAVDLGLIAVEGEPEAARPGPALEALADADAETVLDLWFTAATVVAGTTVDAAVEDAELEEEAVEAAVASATGESAEPAEEEDESEEEYARAEERREETQSLLDDALQTLYETRAFAKDEAGQTLPLGVLAALLVVPDGEEPDEEMLGEITEVMITLDPMLQDLAAVGMLDYSPIDPALFEETEEGELEAELDDADVARFGQVRLTDLGLFAVREWLMEDGYDAPLIGERAEGTAAELLEYICSTPNVMPEAEIEAWLAGREAAQAATELLAAARGSDITGPIRRYFAGVALARLGDPVEEAARAALTDPHLSGVATAWLAAHGADDLPEPSREVLLWTYVDVLAGRVIAEAEDQEMVRKLVAEARVEGPPAAWFDELWRVQHPYTVMVLNAVGAGHPDKSVAKEARKAAYKARSQAKSR